MNPRHIPAPTMTTRPQMRLRARMRPPVRTRLRARMRRTTRRRRTRLGSRTRMRPLLGILRRQRPLRMPHIRPRMPRRIPQTHLNRYTIEAAVVWFYVPAARRPPIRHVHDGPRPNIAVANDIAERTILKLWDFPGPRILHRRTLLRPSRQGAILIRTNPYNGVAIKMILVCGRSLMATLIVGVEHHAGSQKGILTRRPRIRNKRSSSLVVIS